MSKGGLFMVHYVSGLKPLIAQVKHPFEHLGGIISRKKKGRRRKGFHSMGPGNEALRKRKSYSEYLRKEKTRTSLPGKQGCTTKPKGVKRSGGKEEWLEKISLLARWSCGLSQEWARSKRQSPPIEQMPDMAGKKVRHYRRVSQEVVTIGKLRVSYQAITKGKGETASKNSIEKYQLRKDAVGGTWRNF